MGYPRSFLVDPLVGGVHHCVSRCVRRESLIDSPDRCAWIVERLERLAATFAVDVCDFAVMRNHVHLLLRTHPDLAMAWSDEEVARRWIARPGARERDDPEGDLEAALADPALVAEWRSRLSDLGWFHKSWKEPAAKAWNREDDVAGHFWEGRFHSVGCADEAAVLMQATYILLNPVHCGAESELIDSPRTSTGRRLKALAKAIEAGRLRSGVEAYEAALLEPAIPCDPGGEVPRLDDREWSRRLAERTYERALREAAAEEARRAADRARRFDHRVLRAAEESAGVPPRPVAVGEMEQGNDPTAPAARPTMLLAPGARHLRTRQPTPPRRRIPTPPWIAAPGKENPWRARTTFPMVEGCTLVAFIEFADDRGRVERPDKAGRIDPTAPRAVQRLLDTRGRTGRAPPAHVRTGRDDGPLALAARLLDAAESAIARIVAALPGAHCRDGPPRIAWRGTVAGAADAAEDEAARRGTRRVETVRPTGDAKRER